MGKNAAKAVGAQGRLDAHLMDPDALKIIEDDKKHPLYDGLGRGKGVSEDTVLNIMEFGILQPILCRRAGEKGGKAIIEVIAGRDRVRAARIANSRLKAAGKVLVKVPVIFKRGDDKRIYGMMLSENIHRKDLSPLYKAEQMQRYIDLGASDVEAMRELKISTGTVRNYKALLECSTKVKALVDSFDLSSESAIELSKMSHPEQDKAVDQMIAAGATKGLKAKEAAKNARAGKKARPNTTSRMLSRKKLEVAKKVFGGKPDSTSFKLAAALTAVYLGEAAALKQLPEALQQSLREILK